MGIEYAAKAQSVVRSYSGAKVTYLVGGDVHYEGERRWGFNVNDDVLGRPARELEVLPIVP